MAEEEAQDVAAQTTVEAHSAARRLRYTPGAAQIQQQQCAPRAAGAARPPDKSTRETSLSHVSTDFQFNTFEYPTTSSSQDFSNTSSIACLYSLSVR